MFKRKIWSFLLLFTWLCFANFSFGQQFNIHSYTLEQGLAQSQVYSLCQDQRGFLWMGTYGSGVSIFDGSSFRTFNMSNGLINNSVWSILEDDIGRIWVGTNGGISVYDGREIKNYTVFNGLADNTIEVIFQDSKQKIWVGTEAGLSVYNGRDFYTIEDQRGFLKGTISDIEEDDQGRIWVGCYNSGVCIIVDENKYSYMNEKEGLISNSVNTLMLDSKNAMWIGTDMGISVTKGLNLKNITAENGVSGNMVTALMEDAEKRIWIGTQEGGVTLLENDKFTYITDKNGLTSNFITMFITDNSGQIWIGTDQGGVCKYAGPLFTSYNIDDGLNENTITAINTDSEGRIWLGTDTRGLNIKDGDNMINANKSMGFDGKNILSITRDKSGDMWVSTYFEGLFKYDGKKFTQYKKELASETVNKVFVDRSGKVWMGCYGGLTVFDGIAFKSFIREGGFHEDQVLDITETTDGSMWFATEHGLVRLKNGGFKTFQTDDGLYSNAIITMCNDEYGNLWLGLESGISFFDGKNFTYFNENDGLSSGNIYSLLVTKEKNEDYLYVGTEKGFDKIKLKNKNEFSEIRNYSKPQGFKGVECNHRAVYQHESGDIWFGTIKGVSVYKPDLDVSSMKNPKVHITGMQIFFEKINWQQEYGNMKSWFDLPGDLQLQHNKNHLTFEFVGIQLNQSGGIKYSYILEGAENEWSPATKNNKITYSNVQPGKYRFRVRAMNDRGEWMKEGIADFPFEISPPLWKSWWFLTLISVGGVVAIYSFFVIRTRNLKRAKEILEEKVKERTERIEKQKQELERLSIVASETVQAIIIADQNGDIEWINSGMEKMTGFNLERIKKDVGSNIAQVSTYPRIRELIENLKRTKKPAKFESQHVDINQDERWTAATVTPILNENEEIKNIVVIYTDITEIKHHEEELQKKNDEVMDSILYAKQIQDAIFPNISILNGYTKDSFLFYRPREIVSGDFYWFQIINDKLLLCAADCTGHGVPGALMSMIGNEFLHQISLEKTLPNTGNYLNLLDDKIKRTLHQVGEEEEQKEGMDIALCSIDTHTNMLQFSGAYRPCVLVRNGEIVVLPGDKISVGGYYRKGEKEFTVYNEQLNPGDCLYVFSDGYTDQFGGGKGKKFLQKRLIKLLRDIYTLPMDLQKERLIYEFEEWRGDMKQVDDIVIIGMRY